MTVSMPVVWSSIGSSQPVGWLVTESVLMFRRVKPTVAMPLGASMKTAGLSNDTAPESLSLLHDTANAAAVTTTAISFTNPFILPKFTLCQFKKSLQRYQKAG